MARQVYPESVLTDGKGGKPEVRSLVSSGSFVKYNYIDPESGKLLENGKFSIVLKPGKEGKEEHYFMIPMKGRFLAIPDKSTTKDRYVWDKKLNKPVKA